MGENWLGKENGGRNFSPEMRLVLHNIGRYTEVTIEIPDPSPDRCLINVTGHNGAGKTTIFRALMWCMTDHDTDFDIPRHDAPNGSPINATLYWGNIVIYKQKSPNYTQVRINGTDGTFVDYNQDQAFAFLQNSCGTARIMQASCYLAANIQHPLLTVSANEKLEILRELALSSVDPTSAINNVAQLVQQYKQQFTSSSISLARDKANWEQQSQYAQWNLYIPPEGRNSALVRVAEIPSLLSREQARQARISTLGGQMDLLLRQIQGAPTEEPQEPDASRLSLLRTELQAWQIYETATVRNLRQSEKRQDLEKRVADLRSSLGTVPSTPVTPENLAEASKLWELWQKSSAAQDRLGVTDLSQSKSAIQALLEYRRFSHQSKTVDELTAQVQGMEIHNLTNLVAEEVALKERLMRKPRKCPHCSTMLSVEGDTLVIIPHPVAGAATVMSGEQVEDSKSLTEKLKQVQHKISLFQRRSALELSLHTAQSALPGHWQQLKDFIKLLPPQWHELSEDFLRSALQMESQQKPDSSPERISSLLRLQSLEASLAAETANLDIPATPGIPKAAVEMEIRQLESAIREYQTRKASFVVAMKSNEELSRVRAQLEDLSKEPSALPALQQELTSLQTQVSSWSFTDAMYAQKAEIEKKMAENQNLNNSLFNWNHIHQTLIEGKYFLVEHAISTINRALENIMPYLFDRVTMELKSEKEDSRHNKKSAIHVEITKHRSQPSVKVTSIKSFSGSEQKRLSLALTLACRAVSRTPLILLDEVFSTVDSDFCTQGRRVIRDHLKDVTGVCLIINHHDQEGAYDDQIRISDSAAQVPDG